MIDRASSSDFRWRGCLDGNTVWNEDTEDSGHNIIMDSPRPQLGLRFARHSPLLARVLVPVLLGQHNVQQHEVVLGRVQARHRGPHSGEHAPAQEKCQQISQWWGLAVWSIMRLCLRWVISSLISPSSPNCLQSPHLKLSKQICLSGQGAWRSWNLSDNCTNNSPERGLNGNSCKFKCDFKINLQPFSLFYLWKVIYVKFLLWILMLRSEYCKVQL